MARQGCGEPECRSVDAFAVCQQQQQQQPLLPDLGRLAGRLFGDGINVCTANVAADKQPCDVLCFLGLQAYGSSVCTPCACAGIILTIHCTSHTPSHLAVMLAKMCVEHDRRATCSKAWCLAAFWVITLLLRLPRASLPVARQLRFACTMCVCCCRMVWLCAGVPVGHWHALHAVVHASFGRVLLAACIFWLCAAVPVGHWLCLSSCCACIIWLCIPRV